MKRGIEKAKRIAAALSALLLVFCSVPFFVSPALAEETYPAFTKPSLEVDSDALYKKSEVLDDFSSVDAWTGSDSVKSVERSTYTGGADCVLLKADGENAQSLSVSRGFEGEDGAGVPSVGYDELSFSVVFGGDGEGYTLSAVIGTTVGDRTYECAISPDVGTDVFLDLTDVGGAGITSFALTVTSDDAKYAVSYAALSALVIGDVSHSQIAERYSALYVYGGEITDEGIKVTPKDGSALVRAEAVLPTGAKSAASTAMISLTLRKVGYAKITMLTSSYPAWRKDDYREMTSLTVTSETETYVFCFDSPDKIASWALSFEGLSTTDTDYCLIEDVTLSFGGSSGEKDGYSGLGTVTKCAYSADGTIAVSGTVLHDAVVDHINGSIGLYMIPAGKSVEKALAGEPAVTADISTSFTFKIDTREFPTASACRFAVALIKDGTAIPIDAPVWPSPSSAFIQDKLPDFIALSDSVADTFELGAGAAVIDLDVSKLIRPPNDTNSRLVSWDNLIFYFSQSVLSAIGEDTAFYKAAGIDLYFRILCSTDRFSAAPGTTGEYYAADVSTESGGKMMAAIVDYFSERFSPAGYIIGSRLNVQKKNMTQSFTDAFTLMEKTADCARLVYSVALRYDPYTVVILPFEAQPDETDDAAAANKNAAGHSAITCTALADYYISRDSTPIRWASLVAADETSSDDIPSQAATNHGSGFIGTAITPADDEATSFEELKKRFPLALFYAASVGESEESFEVGGDAPAVFELPESDGSYTGSVTLWDFSRSFSADSFVLSTGRSLSTGACPVFSEIYKRDSERVLYLDLSQAGEDTTHVAAAAPLAEGVDLEDCRAVEFRLAAFSDGESSPIAIHMGNASTRLRYDVTLENAKACSVVCRLPAGVTPSYFAICAEADDGVSVRLSSVNALSDTLDGEALATAVFRTAETESETGENPNERNFQLLIAVVSGLTVAVFVGLNRRNRLRKTK